MCQICEKIDDSPEEVSEEMVEKMVMNHYKKINPEYTLDLRLSSNI